MASTSEPTTMTATYQYDASTEDSDQQGTHFEAFEYQDLADVAKTIKNAFDELTGVSPLWFSVEQDAGGGTRRHSVGGKRGGRHSGCGDGGGYEMFGDWRVEESLVDAFENQPQAGSDKQEVLKTVNALLATYDENGTKQRQGLEECVVAFAKAIEGDLDMRLDELTEQCTQRWNEEQEKTGAAQAGLTDVEADTAARLEELGQVLKDRRDTVLAALKHEREASKRKIMAATMSDPLEEGRTLFNRQVEETELEGRLKQRQRLLNLSSQGVLVQQEEVEEALLKAARDQVENLMKVVEKMQSQQTKLLVTLQAEKKNVSAMRQLVSSRLDASSKKDTTTVSTQGSEAPGPGKGGQGKAAKKGKISAIAVTAAVAIEKLAGRGDDANGVGPDGQAWLSGTDLLDACDRLENDNLHFRQRLAKLELQTMQKEHGDDGDDDNLTSDSRVSAVLEVKRELESKLNGLQTANKERSSELERVRGRAPAPSTTVTISTTVAEPPMTPKTTGADKDGTDDFHANIEVETKTLTQKVKTLRRKLVFKLACKVMRRRFKDAGMGPGNNPDPPQGPIPANDSQVEAAEDGNGFPREMQAHAALLRQKNALQYEVERAARQEQEIQRAIAQIAPSRDGPANAVGQPRSRVGSCEGVADEVERKGDGDDQSGGGVGGKDETHNHVRKRSSTRDDKENGGHEDEEGGSGGQPKLKKSKVAGGLRDASGKRSPHVKSSAKAKAVDCDSPDQHVSARLRTLSKMQSETKTRLSVLRSLVVKNEEATQANVVNPVDSQAIAEVLRNEGLAREKAVAVLDILCSRSMARTRAQWLKEALERSMAISTSSKSGTQAGDAGADAAASSPKEASQATPVTASAASAAPAPDASGVTISENAAPSAPGESIEASPLPIRDNIDVASGAGPAATIPTDTIRGCEEGAQLGDKMASNPGEKGGGRIDPNATGDDSEDRNPEAATPKVDAGGWEGSAEKEQGKMGGDASESRNETARKAEEMAVVEDGLKSATAAIAETTATDRQTEDEKAKASERELCAKLVQARAEKLRQIKELREKVKAAGGGKPRSMSKELEEHAVRMAAKKAKEARRKEKLKRITTAEGRSKEAFKSLPPKTKREISNLRKQESSLIARYELCVERIKKVLLSRGFSPAETGDVKDSKGEPSKHRKWTSLERSKEAFLHSLTPQLERWRARIVATTIVLEEEKARRDKEMAIQAAAGDGEHDWATPPETASQSETIRKGSSTGGRPGERSGTPSQTPPLHVPHASNIGAGQPLLTADSQWRDTATAASPHGPGYQDDRARGGSGGVGPRYQESSYDTTTRGEVADQGLQGVIAFTGRAKEAARKRVAKAAVANTHGSSTYLATKRTSGGTPSDLFASAGTFPSPRPPASSPLPSSPSPRSPNPSPRSPNVPPAARYSLERWQPQQPLFSAAEGVPAAAAAAAAAADAARNGRRQDIPSPSLAPSTHTGQTIMSSQQELKDYSSSDACPTNTKSSVSVKSWNDGLDSTVTLPMGIGGGGLVSQSSLFSPDLSVSHQEQRQQQQRNTSAVGGGMVPPGRVNASHRPPLSGLAPGDCYATEQQRRQLLEEQLLQPARPSAGWGAAVVGDRAGSSTMHRLGDASTSPFSLTAPLSPSKKKPVQKERSQKQHLSIIKSQMGHPQRQPNWRVLINAAQERPMPSAYEGRGQDGGNVLRRPASSRVQRSLDLRPQQQDAVATPLSKLSLLQPSSHSPSLGDPLSLMAGASAALAASSPRSGPFSPPREIVTARKRMPPPIAVEGVSIVVEAGRDTRVAHPQPRLLRETGASNVALASSPPKTVASLPVGEAGTDNGDTDSGGNNGREKMSESEPNANARTAGDISSRATGISMQQHQHQQGEDVQHSQQESRGRASWTPSPAMEPYNNGIKSNITDAGNGKDNPSVQRGLGLVVQQEVIQPRPPWRQAPSSKPLASVPHGNPSLSGRLLSPGDPSREDDRRSSNTNPSPRSLFLPPEVLEASGASHSPRRGTTLLPGTNAGIVSTSSTSQAVFSSLSPSPLAVAEPAANVSQPPVGGQSVRVEDVESGGRQSISNNASSSAASFQFIPIPTATAEAPPQPSSPRRNMLMVGAAVLDANTSEPSPSSCRRKGKLQNHRGGTQSQRGNREQIRWHCVSAAGDGSASVDFAAAPLTEVAATKPVSSQPVLLADEWMDTEWRPSFALPCGGTRTVVTVVPNNNNRPSTMNAGLQPIFTQPASSDGKGTSLRMVGKKIAGEEVVGNVSVDDAAATTVGCAPTLPSPGGLSRGRAPNGPRLGRGGRRGRGGGTEGEESARNEETLPVTRRIPTSVPSPARHTSGNTSNNTNEDPLSSLLTTSNTTSNKNSSRSRAATTYCETGPESTRPEENTREGAVSAGQRSGGGHERKEAVNEQSADGEDQLETYLRSPPPSPAAWTPTTGERPLFSAGEVEE